MIAVLPASSSLLLQAPASCCILTCLSYTRKASSQLGITLGVTEMTTVLS